MSTGTTTQFVDYQQGSDTGADDPSSIQPIINGEDVVGADSPAQGDGVLNRPAQNLRARTEYLRGILDDTLYLRDADRGGLALAGPGLVSWGGPISSGGSGVLSISDDLYLLPFLTPGQVQIPPVPPVASKFGTLVLVKADGTPAITVQSLRRSYAAGDRINITVIAGGAPGSVSAATPTDNPQRTIILTANQPSLNQVIAALNAVQVDAPATPLVQASLAAGALGTDLLLVPQAQQFVHGNYDAEAHTLTPANLAAFFAVAANLLDEGDSLCIQYASMIDPLPGPPLGGRRQSIPENNNTAIPPGSYFNSRLNPERLVNAIPLGKVIGGRFVFFTGPQLLPGTTNIDLGSGTFPGGPAWADGTPNPPATVANELIKIISDLASELAASDGADKIGVKAAAFTFGAVLAQTLSQRLAAFDTAKPNLQTRNDFALPTDDQPSLVMARAPQSEWKLWTEFPGGMSTPLRIYAAASNGGYLVTANAEWRPATQAWHQSSPAFQSYGLFFDLSNFQLWHQFPGAPDWSDSAWNKSVAESNGTLQLAGQLTVAATGPTTPAFVQSLASGLTPVFHQGSGTGSIQPTLATSKTGGVVYAIRIIQGGPANTATYQFSSDGGVTWSATVTLAANGSAPGSAIRYSATGVFAPGDHYYFAPLVGFVPVMSSYAGPATGTVFVTGQVPPGRSLNIEILTAGGPGVAQFEAEEDGEFLTVGIIPASGNVFGFSFLGTFNALDQFTFQSDTSDLVEYQDASQQPRSTVNQLGYANNSRRVLLVEEVLVTPLVTATSGVVQGQVNNRLLYYLRPSGAAGGFSNLIGIGANNVAPFAPALTLLSDNNTTSQGALFSTGAMVSVTGSTEAKIEIDAALLSATNTSIAIGFTDSPLAQFGFIAPNARAWFYTPIAGTTWHCLASSGATVVDIDTGIPTDTNWHHFGVEIYGLASRYGGLIRWLLDDVIVAADKTIVPRGMSNLSYFMSNQGNNLPGPNGSGARFSQLYFATNRG